MRISIICVGRARKGPERVQYQVVILLFYDSSNDISGVLPFRVCLSTLIPMVEIGKTMLSYDQSDLYMIKSSFLICSFR